MPRSRHGHIVLGFAGKLKATWKKFSRLSANAGPCGDKGGSVYRHGEKAAFPTGCFLQARPRRSPAPPCPKGVDAERPRRRPAAARRKTGRSSQEIAACAGENHGASGRGWTASTWASPPPLLPRRKGLPGKTPHRKRQKAMAALRRSPQAPAAAPTTGHESRSTAAPGRGERGGGGRPDNATREPQVPSGRPCATRSRALRPLAAGQRGDRCRRKTKKEMAAGGKDASRMYSRTKLRTGAQEGHATTPLRACSRPAGRGAGRGGACPTRPVRSRRRGSLPSGRHRRHRALPRGPQEGARAVRQSSHDDGGARPPRADTSKAGAGENAGRLRRTKTPCARLATTLPSRRRALKSPLPNVRSTAPAPHAARPGGA